MKANFYLKSKNPDQEQLIYLFFSFSDTRLKYSTGQKVFPKHWNDKDQRIKKSYYGYAALNEYLESLDGAIHAIYRQTLAAGENPTIRLLKSKLDLHLKKTEPKRPKEFLEAFSEFIQVKSNQVELSTLKKSKTLLNTLTKFSKKMKVPLLFENVNSEMYVKFKEFRVAENISNETISREIVLFKEFLMHCTNRAYFRDTNWIKEWKTEYRDKKVLALTEIELSALHEYPTKSELESVVLDMLLFSCLTSLRWSDMIQISRQKVDGLTLSIYQKKTKNENIVHLNKFAIPILEKYNYEFPKRIGKHDLTNSYANKVLKRIAKDVGLTRLVVKEHLSGSKLTADPKPLHTVIGMHWGRKSYITISLARGMRHEVVMEQSGHKKLETLQRYIAVNREMVENESEQAWDTIAPKPRKIQ